MSKSVKLAAKLAKDEELNGLDSWSEQLVADPSMKLFVYGWLEVRDVVTNVATGHTYPIVEFARLEPHGSPGTVPGAVIEAYMKAYKDRTGNEPLPFELTQRDVVEGGFIEPATGDDA